MDTETDSRREYQIVTVQMTSETMVVFERTLASVGTLIGLAEDLI